MNFAGMMQDSQEGVVQDGQPIPEEEVMENIKATYDVFV